MATLSSALLHRYFERVRLTGQAILPPPPSLPPPTLRTLAAVQWAHICRCEVVGVSGA